MTDVTITWEWKVRGPLHIGTGFSRAGFVDRCVRIDGGRATIPGEAVKGAIRGSAEQLARWLGWNETEHEDNSFPQNPVVRRIFASEESARFYRFQRAQANAPSSAYAFASTSIDPVTRSATENTLRRIELWPSGATFECVVRGHAGDWADPSSSDRLDLLFLMAAIASVEGIGGKKGSGAGALSCSGLTADAGGIAIAPEFKSDFGQMKAHVLKGE